MPSSDPENTSIAEIDPQDPATWPSVLPYSVGLCAASVCTGEDDERTAAALNRLHPTGISSQWSVADDATFADGTPNPCHCPDDPERRHVLFTC